MNFRQLLVSAALLSTPALAQYNPTAGKSAPPAAERKVEYLDSTGKTAVRVEQVAPVRDNFGNAQGANYDLAVNGAFDGQTVLVVDLYGQSFDQPAAALKEKGFSVVRVTAPPSPASLKEMLAKSNQFWILASCNGQVSLGKEHHKAIREFFEAGHGVYLWGDNDPCNDDADALARTLIDASVRGDLPGNQVVGLSRKAGQPGITQDHLLSTGVERIYEGVTVATVKTVPGMTPIIYGSAGNLITAAYAQSGRRLILDGGYTRLSNSWDTAGTGRYVKNAAAWLANYERFGDGVVADRFRKK